MTTLDRSISWSTCATVAVGDTTTATRCSGRCATRSTISPSCPHLSTTSSPRRSSPDARRTVRDFRSARDQTARSHTTGTSAHRGTTCRRLPVTPVRQRRRLARPNAPTTRGQSPRCRRRPVFDPRVTAAARGVAFPARAWLPSSTTDHRSSRNGFCPLLAHWEGRTGHNRAQQGGTRAFPGEVSDQGKSPAQPV